MYILEIFNHLLRVDGSINESNQVVDLELPQGHVHLTILSNRFSRAVCLVNLVAWALLLTQLGSFPITNYQMSYLLLQSSNPSWVLKRWFAPPGYVHRYLFTPPISLKYPSDNIVHMSPGNCSPASVIKASYSKWMKCHTPGYINYTPFDHKSFRSCLLTSQELKTFQWLGQKMFTYLISLSDAQELYFIYF